MKAIFLLLAFAFGGCTAAGLAVLDVTDASDGGSDGPDAKLRCATFPACP